MQTDYRTYWSILDTPAESIQSSSVSICIAIGAGVLWLLIKKFKKNSGDGDRGILLLSTGFFAVFGLVGYISLTFFCPDKLKEETLKMLNSDKTPRIEGFVSDFKQTVRHARYGNEIIESFAIDSIQFAYGDALLAKFNSFTQTNNDVIFNGQRVRITFKRGSRYCESCNTILKLEIAKP